MKCKLNLKIIILLYFCCCFENICFSQSGWLQQTSNTNKALYSVKFANLNTGWCAGESGLILKTTNGGTNWILQNSGFNIKLSSIDFTSTSTGYIAGDSGTIIKTTDGGNSWEKTNLNSGNNLTSINFINDSTGFSGGSNYDEIERKYYFKSIDYGENWDSIVCQNANSISIVYFYNSQIGWIVNWPVTIGGASLFKTTNFGNNWVSSFFTNSDIYSFYFVDTLNGWMSSKSGFSINTIYRTTNGGVNWITEIPGTGVQINSLYFTDKTNGWAAGNNRIIQATTNGGINWVSQTSYQPGVNYRSVYFTDSITGWVVGDSGVILKTTTGGILTGFSNSSSEIPDEYFLSQNYPNPFNPSTNFSFGISKLGFVSLKVYDVLGNEVATLVNENKPVGSYKVEFDGSEFASGIYFYRLEVDGNHIDTKRMILLK